LRGSSLIAHRWVFVAGMAIGASARAAAQDASPPSIQLMLPSSHERWRAAITSAAEQAAAIGHAWLGPHPDGTISKLTIDPPVWQGRGAMVVERQAAQAAVRTWWPADLSDRRAGAMLDGFAWYLQGHAVERLFDRRYLRTAHSVESVAMFGGAMQWSVPTLRLSRWSAGILRHDEARRAGSRYAAMFATLERWLGAPALQSAMFEVARLPADSLKASIIVNTINTAVGQDLSWLFTATGDSAVTFDYAVTGMASTSAACASPCFETTVTATRVGDGKFTGRSTSPAGEFDAGDAIALRVTFENGEHIWARWDGRDQSRTFRFQGPARAQAAHLDPDRVLVLDANYLNNQIVPSFPTNAPVGKWMARWVVWLQNTALSYGFFA
jgi:hypothetical protein